MLCQVPNIAHQLVNMKLFQMLLTQRSVLERYTESPEMTEGILNLFTETLTLDLTEEGDANARLGKRTEFAVKEFHDYLSHSGKLKFTLRKIKA